MSTRFGWCITNQHKQCIRKIQWNGDLLCDCTCHGSNDVEYEPVTEPETENTNEEHNG